MQNKEEIAKFVDYVLNLYGNWDKRDDFYSEFDEDAGEYGEFYDVPLFTDDEDYNEEKLRRLSIFFGLTKEEILERDEAAANRYFEKYPFFQLYRWCWELWQWSKDYKGKKPTPEENLMFAIFGGIPGYAKPEKRYRISDIRKRLIATLKECDKVMPGVYHKNAKITNLNVSTEVFFSFPLCGDMIRSFLQMVERLKELFFKAVHSDLQQDEINELNFLASWLDAVDVVTPSSNITYDNICVYRSVYLEENLNDFFSYVKIKRQYRDIAFVPWRCKEFFDDMELAQEFVNVLPDVRPQIREFATDVTNYTCIFVWSDAGSVMFPEDEDENCQDEWDYIPMEERAREHTRVYVEKTGEEIAGWEPYVQRVNAAASPAKMGGLSYPKRELDLHDQTLGFKRMTVRVEARHSQWWKLQPQGWTK